MHLPQDTNYKSTDMTIAILYICTGRYNRFWDLFYNSCEKYFIPNSSKEYFVFTDDLALSHNSNVHVFFKKCEGFPKDSLFRFDMFLNVKTELQHFDYIFFINSNAQFLHTITDIEVLPNDSIGLVGAYWPRKTKPLHIPMFFPYERNKQSTAYIAPYGKNYHYYMGGINGGCTAAYLKMIETLANNINIDYQNGIIARVHDESHINKYFHSHPPKVLPAPYCWPEEWPCSFQPKMIFRDKVKLDPYFNKGRRHSLLTKIPKLFNAISTGIKWYL